MRSERRKQSSDRGNKKCSDNEHPANLVKYKFNISMDNLKPFMIQNSSTKTIKKESYFSEMDSSDSPTLQVGSRSSNEDHKIKSTCQIERDLSPIDLSRQVSNEIISKIELNGIRFEWDDIEQDKSEGQFEQMNKQVWSDYDQTNASKSHSNEQKNISLASTIDHYSLIPYYNAMMYQIVDYSYEDKNRYYDPAIFTIDCQSIENDQRTTLMIKNIPNKYTIQHLAEQIDAMHANTYDFLYLPCDIRNSCNVGYGFINFVNTEVLLQFYLKFNQKRWLKFRSEKICVLTYARLQGLSSLIEHLQNSKVLNHKDKKYQPIIRQFSKIEHLIKKQQGKGIKG